MAKFGHPVEFQDPVEFRRRQAHFDKGINQRLKEALGLSGVVGLRVAKGSSAEAAGLNGAQVSRDGGIVPRDIIVAVEGKPVQWSYSLRFFEMDQTTYVRCG
jgi:S1-C subfamily serine protease